MGYMGLLGFIDKFKSKGIILLTENNPKNERILRDLLRKHRYKTLHAPTYERAVEILEKKKKVLGMILDHDFRNDKEYKGHDLLRYARRDNVYLRAFPVFLVSEVDTYDLLEYEYLKVNRYFDTTLTRANYAVDEMVPYFIQRD